MSWCARPAWRSGSGEWGSSVMAVRTALAATRLAAVVKLGRSAARQVRRLVLAARRCRTSPDSRRAGSSSPSRTQTSSCRLTGARPSVSVICAKSCTASSAWSSRAGDLPRVAPLLTPPISAPCDYTRPAAPAPLSPLSATATATSRRLSHGCSGSSGKPVSSPKLSRAICAPVCRPRKEKKQQESEATANIAAATQQQRRKTRRWQAGQRWRRRKERRGACHFTCPPR